MQLSSSDDNSLDTSALGFTCQKSTRWLFEGYQHTQSQSRGSLIEPSAAEAIVTEV